MKLLWLSDSPFTTTGYSTVSLNVLNGLASKHGYDCHFMSHNYLGQDVPPNPAMLQDKTPFHFTLSGNGREQYCKDVIVPKIRELKPEYFGILLDTFMTYPWILDLDFAPAKSFFYFPSDGGGGIPDGCEQILRKVHIPIAMSKFGQQQAKELYGIDAEYIPHGVNTKNFYKLPNAKREELRKAWGFQDKFIVGIAARNQPRKMLDRTVRVAKLLCKQYDNVIFFCHTDPQDPASAFNLIKMIERYQLLNRFIFSGMKYHNTIPYTKLNEIYNLMDVYLSTTSGEGFGIMTIEAMACEVPIVITDYTTSKELVVDNGKCGEVANLSAEVTGSWMVDRAVVDVHDCVKKIDKLYQNPGLRENYGKAGREKVEKYYEWDIVVPQWHRLFEKYKEA